MKVKFIPPLKKYYLREEIEAYLKTPGVVKWIKAKDLLGRLNNACVDGRETASIIANPGGDIALLTEAIISIGKLFNRHLDTVEIAKVFRWRLKTLGSFYMHTDDHALESLAKDLNLKSVSAAFKYIQQPPKDKQLMILNYLFKPSNIGCGHLKLMLNNAEAYGMSRKVIMSLITTFFNTLWNGTKAEKKLINFTFLKGDHQEGAVITIKVPGQVTEKSWLPAVSPNSGKISMFVFHPQATAFIHQQQAVGLIKSGLFPEVSAKMAKSYENQMSLVLSEGLRETVSHLAFGLPQYIFELSQ